MSMGLSNLIVMSRFSMYLDLVEASLRIALMAQLAVDCVYSLKEYPTRKII